MKDVIKKTWTEDTRLLNALQNYTRTCVCGHRIRLTNRYKRAICEYCGKMVYLNKEDEEREKFKEEIRRKLRNG